MLSAEFGVHHLPAAQHLPKHPFCRCGVTSQSTCPKRSRPEQKGHACLSALRLPGCLHGSFRLPSPSPAHRYPNLCSHFWSVTGVSTQGLLFFGRGSGRIASPAQRERPPAEGRRVRASAQVAQAPCSKPRLPSPADADVGDLSRCRGRGDAAPGPSRVLSSLRVGVHFLHSYGCSRCGVGGLSRNLGNDEPRRGAGGEVNSIRFRPHQARCFLLPARCPTALPTLHSLASSRPLRGPALRAARISAQALPEFGDRP